MYDTVIIGAGMSGLAAGIRLAYYDKRVCILERHTTIGGLNSFYRLGGRNYDVGLHAVTNYRPKGSRKGAMARLLRQLRLSWDDLSFAPQVGSTIAFPDVRLSFGNDVERLRSQIRDKFPDQIDAFDRLLSEIVDYDDLGQLEFGRSARQVVQSIISDRLLVEMLFCPVMFYGSAREDDMDFGQFCIIFRSIFLEGLGRPYAGVRSILKLLVRKFRSLGGELRLRAGVRSLRVQGSRVERVVLDDGEELAARHVLSSAGWRETLKLCGQPEPDPLAAGRLSFCETISTLDVPPAQVGYDETIVFFNDSPAFRWRKPDALCDVSSGVICSPNNFRYDRPMEEGTLRITCLANFDRWKALDEENYRLEKLRWYDRIAESAVRFVPDFRSRVVDTDMFTPTTIVRYTGHHNGAIYGSPEKRLDGTTHLDNLFICGTDQGLVGIVGSIISGIFMVNQHLLK